MARMGDRRGSYRILVGIPVGKIPLGSPRHRWEDNIKVGIRGVGRDKDGLIWLRIGTRGRLLSMQ